MRNKRTRVPIENQIQCFIASLTTKIKAPIEIEIIEEDQDQEEDQELEIVFTNILHANPVNLECLRNLQ